MKFCTVINCMDGRVQEQVIRFLKDHYEADFVDSITEPGPVGILSAGKNEALLDSIRTRLNISVNKHNSVGIAVVAHHDCAGNPVPKEQQLAELGKSAEAIQSLFSQLPVLKIWVDENWQVNVI